VERSTGPAKTGQIDKLSTAARGTDSDGTARRGVAFTGPIRADILAEMHTLLPATVGGADP